MMTELEKHYNKFNEDKRLTRKHGQVEYITSMKYIHAYLENLKKEMQAQLKEKQAYTRHQEKVPNEVGINETEDGQKNSDINLKITEPESTGENSTESKNMNPENTGENSAEAKNADSKGNNIKNSDIKILDIGAGTGRYSVELANEGYDVTAVELVKYNLGILKSKKSTVKAYQGTALNLSRFADETFDFTLLFGPMYHLYSFEDKLRALSEAKRVTRKGGIILVAYVMNDYSIITYGFKENNIKRCIEENKITEDFQCISDEKDLYAYIRIDEITRLNETAGVERIKIISADGPANYMRQTLNAMDDETFEIFIKYHLATCERQELLGASAHTLDILRRV